MRIGDVLDRSFELLRREWRAAVAVALVSIIGFGLFFVAFLSLGISVGFEEIDAGNLPSDAAMATFSVLMVVFGLGFAIASMTATGMAVRAATHGPDEGTDWGPLLGHAWPALKAGIRLLGVSLVIGLAVGALIVPIVVIVAIAAGGSEVGVGLAVLGVLLFIFVVMAAALLLAPVFMIQSSLVFGREAGAWRSLGDGFRLMGRAYWPSVGATFIVWLFGLVPVIGGLVTAVLIPAYQVALTEALEAVEA